ncbi:hypothetical protein PVAND_004487 [Polypedilum vanderplanki]|uniref:Gustatory receptor n=1 Tax=Polypedilum vanderplanki TaxID=319348 RepID=A0A9J6BYA1_POLVA|nr:hypothetical protein PVAND_004487 [Polypedilum vanderplanki]
MIDGYDEMLKSFYKRTAVKIIGYIFITALLEMGAILNILSDKYWTFMWITCIVPLTVSRFRHLQHLLFIDLLSCRFRVIKEELKNIARFTKLENNKFITKNNSFYDGLYNKIYSIKMEYNILWETSLLINKSFGFSQLLNLLQNFVQLTCDLYSLYSFLYVNNLENILPLVFQICPTLVVVVLVLKACEICLEEVRYIGFLLHNIEKDIDDERINVLTENFSLQILHEPLVFSVSGFFSMDFMFLKTMIASITTYMVIFIQFMPKSDEQQQQLNSTNATFEMTSTSTTVATTTIIV